METAGRLERALVAATTLADSKMDDAAAAKVLDSAFAANEAAPDAVLVRARILRADLAYRMGDAQGARDWLADAAAIDLGDEDRAAIDDDLRRAHDLREVMDAT